MKKYKLKSGIIVLFLIMLMSCETLDLAPLDYYGSENFWKDQTQVEGYILGVHKQLRDRDRTYWLLGEARGGLQKHGTSSTSVSLDYSSPIKDKDFSKDKTGLSNWGGFYDLVLNINMGIFQLENKIDFLKEDDKKFYLGQLYGIRAFTYFYLYRTYGGVPIITEPKVLQGVNSAEPLYTERSTPKQVLDFIKNELEKSESSFGSNLTIKNNKGAWSKYATLMLKAEVYLWSAKVITDDQSTSEDDLSIAENVLQQVKGNFELLPNFTDVFNYNKKGNNEIIFALRFKENEAINWVGYFTYQTGLMASKYFIDGTQNADPLRLKGSGVNILRNEYIFPFFQSFDDEDTRKRATFLDIYDKDAVTGELINGGLILRKFLGIINSDGDRVLADDIPVYRYADVLLMLAEIENKKGGDAAQYINMIRERAYGENYDPSLHAYVNADFETNELAILAERDKEFVWECKRWFDVRRMQDGAGNPLVFSDKTTYGHGAVLSTGEAHKVLWPVDVNTLNMDPKLKQTPGYE